MLLRGVSACGDPDALSGREELSQTPRRHRGNAIAREIDALRLCEQLILAQVQNPPPVKRDTTLTIEREETLIFGIYGHEMVTGGRARQFPSEQALPIPGLGPLAPVADGMSRENARDAANRQPRWGARADPCRRAADQTAQGSVVHSAVRGKRTGCTELAATNAAKPSPG